ncbi:hypothetical protein BC833DRAFT_595386 [Globomyces pollinis-pini]|nr:hypothetical protein BC833DRAFT_595386 [Globomyces pollinis-pini]
MYGLLIQQSNSFGFDPFDDPFFQNPARTRSSFFDTRFDSVFDDPFFTSAQHHNHSSTTQYSNRSNGGVTSRSTVTTIQNGVRKTVTKETINGVTTVKTETTDQNGNRSVNLITL